MNEGYFVAPTIFTEVDPRMSVAQDEIFGPVVSVIQADDLESALAKANAVGYGLSSSIYTRDLHAAFRYADASEAGMLHVNLPTLGGLYKAATFDATRRAEQEAGISLGRVIA